MVVIQCIDNRGGTAFNARRQSQDQLLRARVLAKLRGRRLWMNAYSRRQFQKDLPPEFPISVDEDFLARAGTGDVCFVEGLPLSPWLDRDFKGHVFGGAEPAEAAARSGPGAG